MKYTFCISVCILGVLGLSVSGVCAQDATQAAAIAVQAIDELAAANPEEPAIRTAIGSYVEAFNKGDAKALAAHWSEQGEYVSPTGDRLSGRQQLEEDFAAYFTNSPGAKIELEDTAISFLSPSVAVESGIARVIAAEQEPEETEYEAIHVRTASGWKIDSVREQSRPAPPPSHVEKLQDLAWMIGRWVNADDESSVETTCRWTTNQNFLVRSFKVFIADRVDFEGTQIIGWDPHAETIRSWMFDSDGGFGVGRWTSAGNRWTVQSLNVMPDGRRASATNIYDIVDENTLTYQSIGRQIEGELLPNIEPVTVVRSADE